MSSSHSAIPTSVQDLRLHFRCEFQVSQEASLSPPLDRIIQEAQRWVLSKNKGNSRGLSGLWFLDKGQWIAPSQHRIRIEVDSAGIALSPGGRFWALRYEHPDIGAERGSSFRQWRTDLSLATVDHAVIFSMQIAHYLLPGHFGPEPEAPEPTSPLLVKRLFQTPGLVTYSGSQPLTAKPVQVAEDDAEILVERITDPKRQCPLIYVSRAFNTGEPVINAERIAWSLAGLAAVYVAESSWLDKETEKLLPLDYRCWNGRVRVFLPNVCFDRPNDFKRHRYFTPEQILLEGIPEIERIIVQSLARRVALSSTTPVLNIDDVRLKRQEESFERLKRQLASTPPAEMLELLESINRDLEQKLQTAVAERKNLADQLEWTQLEFEGNVDELKKSRYEETTMRELANAEREGRIAAEGRAKSLADLGKLPESIEDCCRFFGKAFPERITFTKRGMDSAERAEYPKVNAVWTALWHMTNTLYPLVFSNTGAGLNLEDEFRHRSGIDLGLSEGKLTKANSKLMKLRFDEHEGERIEITPHIKLQTGNKHLRIHFNIHRNKRLFIVGHCGEHLDTAGTAKRR